MFPNSESNLSSKPGSSLPLVIISMGFLSGLGCLVHASWPWTGAACPVLENDSGFSDGEIIMNALKAIC